MSDEKEDQFKILLTGEVQQKLETQRLKLGFRSGNALAAVMVSAFSEVPPERVWEVLAIVQKSTKNTAKYRT